jgi:glucose dehydrogenase
MAPMVYKGKVIIGITGVGYGLHLDSPNPDAPLGAVVGIAGKYGERGFLAAYDAQTGERQWKFDTVPSQGWEGSFQAKTPDGVVLPRDLINERANMEKYADAWRFGGGSAWSTPAIDQASGLLFFGTGNPSPQMEGSSRPGDNLYTVSLVALDANTGERKWHYQQVPHDVWGYDVASPPVLFTAQVKGKPVPAVGQAGKTGWFYAHHRSTGELLYKSEAFVPQSNMFSLPSSAGTVIYPGVVGGSNWSPVSVDEQRRSAFIAGLHWPVKYTLHELAGQAGKPALKYSSMSPMDNVERYGLLSAIDLDSGKLKWQYRTPNPLIGGVLSTRTGLVFTGEGSGELLAIDAATGQKLWSGKADAGVNAPPISYESKGRQYIAVAVGGNKLFGFKAGQTLKVWALP